MWTRKASILGAGGVSLVLVGMMMSNFQMMVFGVAFVAFLAVNSWITGHGDIQVVRTLSADNLYKGQSTFYSEMLELDYIIRTAGPKTLVIADELCSGSEQASAQAILAGTILKLSELGASFFLTTHMHKALELPEVMELSNLLLQHFKVEYDNKTGEIIYDRNITELSEL